MPSISDVPSTMKAAVYRGESVVRVEEVPTPTIGPGELLVRVESCGVCHTDLKKIHYNLLAPPRVFGHETAGIVVAVGEGVTRYAVGDRVIVFHHIPCQDCFYCERRLYAQCPVYKKVGVTAGFEPAGGGFAQYVRVMDWIVESGVEKVPDHVPLDVASFVEPVNTCVKAVTEAAPREGDVVLVQGQGPIGLIFTMLLRLRGVIVVSTDTLPSRRALSVKLGAVQSLDPRQDDVRSVLRGYTQERGADMVFVATSAPGLVEEAVRCSRPGSKIILFAQTSDKERIEVSGADICVSERVLTGSYSASIDVQQEAAALVFSGQLPLAELISHRVPLEQIVDGFALASHPDARSMKIVVQPQRCEQ